MPKRGSTGVTKRRGRGHATGQGGTAGKGHKGQKARTGGRVRWGFEGGQTPLMRRTPKSGFNNKDFRTEYQVVNLKDLEKLSGEVTPETLKAAGLVRSGLVKVLGTGKLSKGLTVKAHKFSAKAKELIEAAGGKTEVIGTQA
ncbi:MAG: 50S ribosomal protein L15 [Bdellovibrionales bacterium]|jgi:large subunit ribosomal protein L15|nr:50S ribosomal protein L15 [Bdellovibrionales bacterium]